MKKVALIGLLLLLVPNYSFALSLEESVKSALDHSQQLKAIQEGQQASVYELDKARSGYGPKIDISSRIGASYLSEQSSRLYSTDKSIDAAGELKLSLSQPLWDGGRSKSRVKLASERLLSVEALVLDNATSVALDVIIAHINVNRAMRNLDYAQSNVAVHENILYAQKQRLEQGVSTKADLDQTRGRLARANSGLADSKANLAEAEQEYYRLTGQKPSNLQIVTTNQELIELDNLWQTALSHNPKLQSLKFDSQQMAAQIDLAKASYRPSLNIELASRYSNRSTKGDNYLASADAMLVAEWNLYSSGANRADENSAKARYRQAQANSANLEDEIYQELANTLKRQQSSQEQYIYYTQALQYNNDTYNGFFEQFKAGERSLLDVLDAENERYNTRIQLESAQANINISYFKIKALTGVLLSQFAIENKLSR